MKTTHKGSIALTFAFYTIIVAILVSLDYILNTEGLISSSFFITVGCVAMVEFLKEFSNWITEAMKENDKV